MAKSSPRGGSGVPGEANGAAEREKRRELDEADDVTASRGGTTSTNGPGPKDARRGRATNEHLERRGLDPRR